MLAKSIWTSCLIADNLSTNSAICYGPCPIFVCYTRAASSNWIRSPTSPHSTGVVLPPGRWTLLWRITHIQEGYAMPLPCSTIYLSLQASKFFLYVFMKLEAILRCCVTFSLCTISFSEWPSLVLIISFSEWPSLVLIISFGDLVLIISFGQWTSVVLTVSVTH